MRQESLRASRVAIVVLFALACFGLLLFLWQSFGGPVPLKPVGYRVVVALPEADLLSAQADVRISGVSVGRVIDTPRRTSPTDPNRKDAVLEIDPQYAPLHRDVRAIIRRKSLAGEMFLELTPGSARAPAIPDGGRLPNANVAPSVDIDEVLRTFDPATRRSFQQWIQQQAAAMDGQGPALNAALGTLPGFEDDLSAVLATLDGQRAAVRAAVRNTGVVFAALGQRRDALQGLITNGERTTGAFARQSRSFADAWRALPTFETESRRLLERADRFRRNAAPVIAALRPAARAFSATMPEAARTAPSIDRLARGLGPLTAAEQRGLPATRRFVDATGPLIQEFAPFLAQLQPALAYIGPRADALTSLVANLSSATEAVSDTADGTPLHYLRGFATINPGSVALYAHPLPTNRSNPYPGDERFTTSSPLRVFDDRSCGALQFPKLAPADATSAISQEEIDRLWHFAFNDGHAVAPPCLASRPQGRFPHVQPLSQTPGGHR